MKPFRYQIIFAFTILFNLNMHARATQMPMAIIPRPVKLEAGDGVFTLTSSTVISSAPDTSPSARVLAHMLDQPTGFNLETTNGAPVRGSCIRLESAPSDATLGKSRQVDPLRPVRGSFPVGQKPLRLDDVKRSRGLGLRGAK